VKQRGKSKTGAPRSPKRFRSQAQKTPQLPRTRAPMHERAAPRHAGSPAPVPSQIAVVGLGYVGLSLASTFGSDTPTIAFDLAHDRIRELRQAQDCRVKRKHNFVWAGQAGTIVGWSRRRGSAVGRWQHGGKRRGANNKWQA